MENINFGNSFVAVIMTVPQRLQYALHLQHDLKTAYGIDAIIDEDEILLPIEKDLLADVDAPDWWKASYPYVRHLKDVLKKYPDKDVLLFEDDVQLRDNFRENLQKLLSSDDTPPHDVLLLGYGKTSGFGFGVSGYLCRVKKVIGTYVTLWKKGSYRNLIQRYIANDKTLRLESVVDHEPVSKSKHIEKTRGIDRVLCEWANGFGLLRLYVAQTNFIRGFFVSDSVMDLSLGKGLDTSDVQKCVEYRGEGFEPSSYLYWKVPVDLLANDTLYFSKIDVPVTSTCNLHCDTCCHLNHVRNHRPTPTVDEVLKSVKGWTRKGIRPEIVDLVGGEPFLRDDLAEIVSGVRDTIGDRCLVIFTNGLLLHNLEKDETLRQALYDTNTLLIVSLHTESQIIKRPEIEAFLSDAGISFVIKNETYLAPIYRIDGDNVVFPRNDPLSAYRASGRRSRVPSLHCLTRNCRTIIDDELYRCSWTAHRILARRHGLLSDFKLLSEHRPAKISDDMEVILDYLRMAEDVDCCFCPDIRIRKDVEQTDITLKYVDK